MREADKVTYIDLGRGLRGVHIHIPGARVGYMGVAVKAGSRDEATDAREAGLAHFVEHTIFKGTRRRSPWHIINRMEAVGGELNAFTTKEDTVVYTAFAAGNLARALDLVADLVVNSRFPDSELDKEREVVADEINSYLDQPAEAVYDDFEDMIFAGTPMGHNILGTLDTVAAFDSTMCRSWLDRYYTRGRMTVFYAGAVGADTFTRMATRHFDAIPEGADATPSRCISTAAPFDTHRIVESHQTHIVTGTALPAMTMQERTVAAMLSNILGGPGMNSLLNVALREKRGLVYNVEASSTFFSDCGEFTIYYGCDPHDVPLCRKLVARQLADMAETALTPRRLAAAKKQYLGQLVLANDNRENRAISIARATLMRGRALTQPELEQMVADVSADDIRDMANVVAAASTLALGPA